MQYHSKQSLSLALSWISVPWNPGVGIASSTGNSVPMVGSPYLRIRLSTSCLLGSSLLFFVVCLFLSGIDLGLHNRGVDKNSTELLPQPWSYNFWSLQSFKSPFSFPMECQRKGLLFMFKPVSQCEELRYHPWGVENTQRKWMLGFRSRALWMGSLAAGRYPPNSLALSSGLKSLNFLVLVLRRQNFLFYFIWC